jgi:prophage antirepressor-like protein
MKNKAKELMPFQFDGNLVRTLVDGDTIWFIAKDVAKNLGYSNQSEAVSDNCKKAKSLKNILNSHELFINENNDLRSTTLLIPESDVYRLTMRSRLESAERFQDWVVEDVLPSIRKTGKYAIAMSEWQKARLEGKAVRRYETDVIKEFVEYAINQGNTSAQHYYALVTTATYKALFILDQGGQWKGLRERMSAMQLTTLSTAEAIAQRYIKEGMELGMNYSDIYLYAKRKVEDFADIFGKTGINKPSEIKLIK